MIIITYHGYISKYHGIIIQYHKSTLVALLVCVEIEFKKNRRQRERRGRENKIGLGHRMWSGCQHLFWVFPQICI